MLEQISETLNAILKELRILNRSASSKLPANSVAPTSTITPPTAPTPAPLAPAPPPHAEISREAVGKALIDLATSKSRDAALAVLALFGVKKLADLVPADFAKFLAEVEKAKL